MVLWFLLALFGLVYSLDFPSVPTQYKVFVAANFDDRNYTLAYHETWDNTTQILRTKGRFGDSDINDVINFTSGHFYRWNDTTCSEILNWSQALLLYPSVWFFNFSDSPKVYVGQEEVRGTPCNLWVQEFNQSFSNGTFTVIYNYTLEIFFGVVSNLPMRVELEGTTTNSVNTTPRVFYHVYDWVDWDVGPEYTQFVGAVPDYCRSDLRIIEQFPYTRPISNLAPQPTNMTIPTIPSTFSTFVETKLEITNNTDEPDLAEFWWHVDLSGQTKYEHVGCETPGVCGEGDSEKVYITWYFNNNTGLQWVYDDDTELCTRTKFTYNVATDGVLSKSPLRRIRAGSVPLILANQFDQTRIYTGRSPQRAVPADTFSTSTITTQNLDGIPYIYNSSTYFFPDGWSFPGRPEDWLAHHEEIPLRVTNEGQFFANGSWWSYEDIWDFFWFVTAQPAEVGGEEAWEPFDPTQFGCSLTDPPAFPTLPHHYFGIVSANFLSENYTLTYEEKYDGTLRVLHTEGRFAGTETEDVFDFNEPSIFRFNATDCVKIIDFDPIEYVQPSLNYFYNATNPVYIGRMEIDREILCDVWESTTSDNSTEFTYYVDVKTQYPIRVEIEREADETIIAVYDWANLTFALHPEIGILPSYCSEAGPLINWTFVPPNTAVEPLPTDFNLFAPPAIPQEFATFVEIKVEDDDDEDEDERFELINLKWVVDLDDEIQKERITCYTEREDCFDGDTARTMINIYYPANATQGKTVTQYFLYPDGTCYYENHAVLSDEPLSFCPLKEIGVGLVGKIMTNRLTPLKYEGREKIRGVDADCWTYTGINDEDEPYESESCFYPRGWAFPGIAGTDVNEQFPLQFTNEVSLADEDDEEEDTWDFFYFSEEIEEEDFVPPSNCVFRPNFPDLPKEYSVYISANMGDHNYTLAYREAYNPALNFLVTRGRYGQAEQVDVIDLNNGIVVRYNETWCGIYENVSVNIDLHQSTLFFGIGGDARKVYEGVEEARGRPCNTWVQTFNLTYPSENGVTTVDVVDVEYYFTVDTNLPIRVELEGVSYTGTTATPFHHVYDWIDWDIEPQYNLNDLPDHCEHAKTYNSSLFHRPTYTNLEPQPPNLNLPVIPPAFSTLVESKWEFVAVTEIPDVAEFMWHVDLTQPIHYERVDCMTDGVCGDEELIYITWYFPNNTARQWIYNEETSLCTSSVRNITLGSPPLSLSPLVKFRAGTVPQIMTNAFAPPRSYIGRSNTRGVPADGFTVITNSDNQGVTYNYNSTTYFYPDGWSFPGRPTDWLAAHEKIPIRIENDGTYTAPNGTLIPYEDIWDFFWFVTPDIEADPDYWDTYDPTQFGCSMGEALPFPSVPTTYKAVVSANMVSRNYTLVYQEQWDNNLRIIHTEGRFVDYNVHDVIYFGNNTMFQWNDTSCVQISPIDPSGPLLQPSMYFFNLTDQFPVYLGRAEEREILCDAWSTTVNQTFNTSRGVIELNYTATYYFDHKTHLPVRVRLEGIQELEATEDKSEFHHVYDWLDIEVGTQIDIGVLPAMCHNAPLVPFQLYALPNATVAPLPADFASVAVPRITDDFSTLVEVKFETGNQTGIALYKWQVDFDDVIRKERVDCYTPELCIQNADTIITWYRPLTDLDTEGTAVQWLIHSDGKCVQKNYVFPKDDHMAASPFREIRAGTLPSIISNSFGYRHYIGRTEMRGVPADAFTAFGNSDSPTGTYTYNSTLYFFPEGWGFPGRPNLGHQVPLQVTNKGLHRRTSDGFVEEYEDRWDLYFFVDDPEFANTTFDPKVYNCFIPDFPTPTRAYRSFVSANLGEANYTLAFEEWYNPAYQVLRTEGRFVDYDVIDVIDFGHNTHYRYNETSCVQFANATRSYQFQPSLHFFNMSVEKDYVGEEIIRGRSCSVWSSVFTNETANNTLAINYFFDPKRDHAPVRVAIQGQRHNLTTNTYHTYYHYYDWIDFIWLDPRYKPEEEPADLCKNAKVLPFEQASLNRDYHVNPETNLDFPQFPLQFTAIIEARLQGYDVVNLQWAVDLTGPIQRERVDCISPNCNPQSVITWYQENIAIQWLVGLNGNCARIVYENATALSRSPLMMRAGSIPLIFGNNVTGLRYNGRSLQRGVHADTFGGTFIGSNGNSMFDYNSSVYFFPQGWGFPGRPDGWINDTTHQIPLRVVNTGRGFDNDFQASYTYTDVWDFYLFVVAPPTIEDPDIFDPNSDFACPIGSTGDESSNPLSPGLIAIIVIICALVVAVTAHLLYVKCVRKTQTTAHVELQETVPEVDQEGGERVGTEQETTTVPTTEKE